MDRPEESKPVRAEVEGLLSWPRIARGDDLVEGPHVDKVEELREELDGEGGVDAAPPQQVHRRREHVHHAGDHLLGAVLVRLEQHLGSKLGWSDAVF